MAKTRRKAEPKVDPAVGLIPPRTSTRRKAEPKVDPAVGLIPPRTSEDDNTVGMPIAQPQKRRGLAPLPQIDKFPIVVGQGLNLTYVASCYRTAMSGYRMTWVDLLNELLQKEPHGYAVIWKRILGVAGARLTIDRPEWIKENDPDYEQAEAIRAFVERQILSIPKIRQHLAFLAWAVYYAVTGLEIHWTRDEARWTVERLSFIHSRRLSYPDFDDWNLYIWDQGQVTGSQWIGSAPTNSGTFGLKVANFPHKFIIHAPQLRGDYPTREGLGLQLAEWFVFKRLGARMGSQYLERWGKPFMDISFTTGEEDKGHPRAADEKDIALADQAAGALGAGALSSWVHPDSVKVQPLIHDTGKKALTFGEWISLCNAEISKPVLGNTLTTEVGSSGGNRALGQVHESEEDKILNYDAQSMSDTLGESLIASLVILNYGRDAMKLAPRARLHVKEPDPHAVLELATLGAASGIAVDGDKVAETVGLPVTKNPTSEPRRMVPVAPVAITLIDQNVAEVADQQAEVAMKRSEQSADNAADRTIKTTSATSAIEANPAGTKDPTKKKPKGDKPAKGDKPPNKKS